MYSLDAPGSTIEDFQVEPIADTGLPSRAQISVIFSLDLSSQVQDHTASSPYLLEKFDCRQPTP